MKTKGQWKHTAMILIWLIITGISLKSQPIILTPDTLISQEMTGDSLYQYALDVPADWFVAGLVRQQGVDLTIQTSAGEVYEEFDRPNGQWGAEVFTIRSEDSAKWLITIKPWKSGTREGNFELSIYQWEPLAHDEEARVAQLLAPWNHEGSPGVAVAIIKDDQVLSSAEAGLANLEYQIPITDTSVFHIASVSKQFAAFSMLLLQEEGRLSIDDEIHRYLPDMPEFEGPITIRHLMTHTSGLRDQWTLLIMAGWRMDDVITTEHIMKLVHRQQELNFEPGEEFLYSNTGFTLLAQIVESITDTSYAEWTRCHIFEPLGMTQTQFRDNHELVIPHRVYSYSENEQGYRKRPLNFATAGATSLMTTTRDFTKWAQNFDHPTVGSVELIDELCEQGELNNGATLFYAKGLRTGGYRGIPFVCHGGIDAGYRSFFLRFPDQHLSIVVFSNLGTFPFSDLSYELADIYLENPGRRYSLPSAQPGRQSQPEDEGGMNAKEYIGHYYSPELDTWYEIFATSEELHARHQRHTDISLNITGEDTLEASGLLGTMAFFRDEAGVIQGFRSSNGRVRNLLFEKRNK